MKKNSIPLYFQVEQIIKSKILMGEFTPGDQIPTEKELCKTCQVSSITARQAVLNLVAEGLLVRRQGKGTFVTDALASIKTIKTMRLRGDINDIIPEGLGAQDVKVLDIIELKVPRNVARFLDVEQGCDVIRVRRTRNDGNVPVSYIRNYLPLEIGKKIKKQDLQIHPMLHILRNNLGVPLKGGIQQIEAIVADQEIAFALSVSVCSPILYLETLIVGQKEKPVEFVQTFYRPDQFRYTVTLDLKRNKKSPF